MNLIKYLLTIVCIVYSLKGLSQQQSDSDTLEKKFSACSNCLDTYHHFNSCQAINKIVDIENDHLINFNIGTSRYYGTLWRQQAEYTDVEKNLEI